LISALRLLLLAVIGQTPKEFFCRMVRNASAVERMTGRTVAIGIAHPFELLRGQRASYHGLAHAVGKELLLFDACSFNVQRS
jgi:hypothetical protein